MEEKKEKASLLALMQIVHADFFPVEYLLLVCQVGMEAV